MILSHYIPLCQAFVRLMDPLVEVVIHDRVKNCIAYISGNLSDRKIGDPSLLDPDGLEDLEELVYAKIAADGRLIKSISVLLGEGYILCINCDVSLFTKMKELSSVFLQVKEQPKSLFSNDWQEKLHVSIHRYVQNHNLSFDRLSLKDKKSLTKYLFEMGAFNEKNAADYVAKVLNLGRATVFKYLKEWKKQ